MLCHPSLPIAARAILRHLSHVEAFYVVVFDANARADGFANAGANDNAADECTHIVAHVCAHIVADALTYVFNSWGNDLAAVSIDEVTAMRAATGNVDRASGAIVRWFGTTTDFDEAHCVGGRSAVGPGVAELDRGGRIFGFENEQTMPVGAVVVPVVERVSIQAPDDPEEVEGGGQDGRAAWFRFGRWGERCRFCFRGLACFGNGRCHRCEEEDGGGHTGGEVASQRGAADIADVAIGEAGPLVARA